MASALVPKNHASQRSTNNHIRFPSVRIMLLPLPDLQPHHDRIKGGVDPRDCNNACLYLTLGCITGLYPLCLILERGRVRKMYNIKGGSYGDFWASVCCVQNVLLQNENGVIAREEVKRGAIAETQTQQ
ncbi:PLAC8 family protein [Aspergillus undulatus]|uniref:PLAC8 family protein n=1 Tax=Aspergillus undulatus TaxID=1810928 RepID=UPI003CCDB5D7